MQLPLLFVLKYKIASWRLQYLGKIASWRLQFLGKIASWRLQF